MRTIVLLTMMLAVPSVQAHFIWVVPGADSRHLAVIFSERPDIQKAEFADKIANVEVHDTAATAETASLAKTKSGQAWLVEIPSPDATLSASLTYGVLKRGEQPAFLLKYYARTGLTSKRDARLALDIVATNKEGEFRVLWQGKPLANAQVNAYVPAQRTPERRITDERGMFALDTSPAGLYGIRVRHVEENQGTFSGEAYKHIRHYTTLTFSQGKAEKGEAKRTEDPAASKLLAEARSARAVWEKFPGFSADIEVNFDGVISRGRAFVHANGDVEIRDLDPDKARWARRIVGSLAGHRLSRPASRNTPCAFADEQQDHPLGRAIVVLNDELHSSYRIKDRQIVEVNRTMGNRRFTITVLENKKNDEGRFLPAHYIVSYWDAKTGQLISTSASTQTWRRLSGFDLPLSCRVVTADEKIMTRTLTFSNHQLLGEPAGK
ncbi:MAG: hypothetical protein KatS3mg105_3764 [Gemmatales bacterium]|nr:MAG: hypothetical protein KatS3mg105_3764 [Gemmatales bacterium]